MTKLVNILILILIIIIKLMGDLIMKETLREKLAWSGLFIGVVYVVLLVMEANI